MNPLAFEIVSAATCSEAFEQQRLPEPERALPITAHTWQRLYAGKLPATASPWWLDTQDDHNGAAAHLWLPEDLPCFEGHFPDQPILPGVMQLDWGIWLASKLWGDHAHATQFAGCARLKFKAPVLPNSLLKLTLKLSRNESSSQPPSIAFALHSASQTLTTAKLLYRD